MTCKPCYNVPTPFDGKNDGKGCKEDMFNGFDNFDASNQQYDGKDDGKCY